MYSQLILQAMYRFQMSAHPSWPAWARPGWHRIPTRPLTFQGPPPGRRTHHSGTQAPTSLVLLTAFLAQKILDGVFKD